MKNAIRCCISCILPCGALDVIRIVHVDGRVEEISRGGVTAAEIMKLHPRHVLRKPSSSTSTEAAAGKCSKIVVDGVVSPDAVLQRGKIYFLIPVPSPPPEETGRRSSARRKKKESRRIDGGATAAKTNLIISDRYLREILTERISTMSRRRGRGSVWRPRLESISETVAEA